MKTSSLGCVVDVIGVIGVKGVMGVTQLTSNQVAEATRLVRSSVIIFMDGGF
jgi:hypothetical protein